MALFPFGYFMIEFWCAKVALMGNAAQVAE
jgi:hypothetical protein